MAKYEVGRRKPEDIVQWEMQAPQISNRHQAAYSLAGSSRPIAEPSHDGMTLPIPSLEMRGFLRERPFAPTNPGNLTNRDSTQRIGDEVRGRHSLMSSSIPRAISQLDDIVFSQGSPRAPTTGYQPQSSPRQRHPTAFEGAFGRTSAEDNQIVASQTTFGVGDFKGKRHVQLGQLQDAPAGSPRQDGTQQQWAGYKSQLGPKFSLHHQ